MSIYAIFVDPWTRTVKRAVPMTIEIGDVYICDIGFVWGVGIARFFRRNRDSWLQEELKGRHGTICI